MLYDIINVEERGELRSITDEWIAHYNTEKPHESLQDLTPHEYLLKYGQLAKLISTDELTTFQQIVDGDCEVLVKNSFFGLVRELGWAHSVFNNCSLC